MIAGFLNHQSYFNKENFLASLRFSGSPTNLYDLRRILNLLRSHTVNGPGSQGSTLLLMVQKSGDHQLRLVIFPIIYGVYTPSKRWLLGIFSINRIFWRVHVTGSLSSLDGLQHQKNHTCRIGKKALAWFLEVGCLSIWSWKLPHEHPQNERNEGHCLT